MPQGPRKIAGLQPSGWVSLLSQSFAQHIWSARCVEPGTAKGKGHLLKGNPGQGSSFLPNLRGEGLAPQCAPPVQVWGGRSLNYVCAETFHTAEADCHGNLRIKQTEALAATGRFWLCPGYSRKHTAHVTASWSLSPEARRWGTSTPETTEVAGSVLQKH